MLNDHIEELTEKLKSLKETNLKLRVSNNVLQVCNSAPLFPLMQSTPVTINNGVFCLSEA
jgi:hypothetical protein